VPLTLVTGPANAAKAGEVLGGLRARLADDPILLVPTFGDVEHAQRELAERGAVFGAHVLRFGWLFQEIARRAGYGERIASEVQRELIVEEAVEAASLDVLAESAAQPGFVRAAARFVAELGRSMVDPARFTRALRDWAGDGPRRAYAEEVAALYRGYRAGLDRAGVVDPDVFAWRALDALRSEPEVWGGTPLFVYGFDDFTPLELDALETISRRCGADVSVSLPFEPGREAFRATARIRQELLARGAEELALEPVDAHYAEGSRAALHQLERRLFEEPGEPVDPGAAISFHSAGGERAEVELAAGRVLELLREGVVPGDVAVVFRRPSSYASLLEQVFGAYGIPYSIDRRVGFGHTGIGRGLLALIRCASLDGSADDLLAYLRTPGRLRVPGLADRLEADVRREGAHGAAQARELWERDNFELGELDRLARARDAATFVAELEQRLGSLFAAPHERQAAVLRGPELDEARALREGQAALTALRELLRPGGAGGGRMDTARVHRALEQLEVHVGENPQPDRVQVATPEAIRARRFEAVFVCGLQEGEFPRGAAPEPFLADEDRRAIASATGLVLPVREDALDRERYLFYVCASRAERLLVLSSRSSDEEGNPQAESFFVEDAREQLRTVEPRRRLLSDVTWSIDDAPTAAELDRALAFKGPRREERVAGPLTCGALLAELAARDAVSAGALEHFADCPVKWLVEDLLKPEALEPDPEAMVRGSYAHNVLEATYRRVRDETGERRVTPANLSRAEQILLQELRAQRSEFRISPKETRVMAAARRLEFDLLRHLRAEAQSDSRFEPEYLELEFGYGNGHEPVEIAAGLRVIGRIDRVDTHDGLALVIDYKSGKRVDRYKVASWEKENRFQAALYMLVVERMLELRAAGGVYVALGGDDPRPRGMVAAEVDALGSRWFPGDRLQPDDFRERLGWALGRIRATDTEMRAGRLCPAPERCDWQGGCKYPSICRSEG
jgi:ATP-dependent helicase/DNAse subunit B